MNLLVLLGLLVAPFSLFAQTKASLNPDISVNTLFLYQNSNRGNDSNVEDPNGVKVQEAEMQFTADVDPYSRFNAVFSLHQDADTTVTPTKREWAFEPEEIYADTLRVPGINIRVGKFKAAMGRHNQLHTHAFPFIDAPLINSGLLGDEGLNDTGVSAAALIPGLSWFSEITLQGLASNTEDNGYFNSRSPNDTIGVAHWKNLWDLNESSTLEFGLSGAAGGNSFDDGTGVIENGATKLWGADLTFKWRPVEGGKYHAFVWSTEFLDRQIDNTLKKNHGRGYSSGLQYQFAQRWWVQARSEYFELSGDSRKYTALLAFVPSEFSGLRLQYSHLDDGREQNEDKVLLQFNVTIGAHPAHMY